VKLFVSLQFLNPRQSVGLLGRRISPLQGRYLTQTQNKHEQTFMPCVGFETTITLFERAKIFHALDGVVTAIGTTFINVCYSSACANYVSGRSLFRLTYDDFSCIVL
jgi:hypothetical protein